MKLKIEVTDKEKQVFRIVFAYALAVSLAVTELYVASYICIIDKLTQTQDIAVVAVATVQWGLAANAIFKHYK